MTNIAELKKVIILTAAYYQRDIKPEVVAMMAEDLADLDTAEVVEAYSTYRRDGKNRSFPLPAQIRDIVCPEEDPEALARQDVDSIRTAIRLFGYMQGDAAKDYMGDRAWSMVKASGGWLYLCETGHILNDSNFAAQLRNRSKDLVKNPDLSLGQLDYQPKEEPKLLEKEDEAINEERKRQLSEFLKSDLMKSMMEKQKKNSF